MIARMNLFPSGSRERWNEQCTHSNQLSFSLAVIGVGIIEYKHIFVRPCVQEFGENFTRDGNRLASFIHSLLIILFSYLKPYPMIAIVSSRRETERPLSIIRGNNSRWGSVVTFRVSDHDIVDWRTKIVPIHCSAVTAFVSPDSYPVTQGEFLLITQ
jgi:hypothetical protein